jgi:phosphoribosylformylglycinamidine synthase
VLDLDLTFLHDGRPSRAMTAQRPRPHRTEIGREVTDPRNALLALLGHPNIASKAAVIHRYDHQIGGATVVRPLVGEDDRGPADGVVLARPGDRHGVAVGIGVNPWYGLHDPESMALAVVDEAIRNVVAAGADPEHVALLDNFSWGDPSRPETLGELVAAVAGCCEAAERHGAPFVSGKDSLNNTYTAADGTRHAVPPTLVITAVAAVPDADRCVTPELGAPGNVLLVVGPTGQHFAGSHLDLLTGAHRTASPEAGAAPRPDRSAPARYRALHQAIAAGRVVSCHDVSEGGLAVALAELCIASGLGATITALPHPDVAAALFSESAGRLVVEVRPDHAADVVAAFAEVGGAQRLGVVTDDAALDVVGVARWDVHELTAAFCGAGT